MDPYTQSNMAQAVELDPASGRMKTVSQFLTSPQPIVPVMQNYEPVAAHTIAGVPFPQTPHQQAAWWNQARAPMMGLKTLFRRPKDSISGP